MPRPKPPVSRPVRRRLNESPSEFAARKATHLAAAQAATKARLAARPKPAPTVAIALPPEADVSARLARVAKLAASLGEATQGLADGLKARDQYIAASAAQTWAQAGANAASKAIADTMADPATGEAWTRSVMAALVAGGWTLIAPGQTVPVRVVEMVSRESIQRVVRDTAGKIVGAETVVRDVA